MKNPVERRRRSKMIQDTLVAYARSDEGRRKSSEAAIKTSARAEIVEQRSVNLKNWRDKNPEKFGDIVEKLTTTFISKPQVKLYELCASVDAGFMHNQQLKLEGFTNRTSRRQVDVLNREKSIVVEFDGPYHFGFKRDIRRDAVSATHNRDEELNRIAIKAGYTVVRVSYSMYGDRSGGTFDPVVLDTIKQLISSPSVVPRLIQLGTEYTDAQDR